MFEQMALKRATDRANQLLGAGDPDGAREELSAFVAKHPRSVQGWGMLLSAVSSTRGTIEEVLDVLRSAAKAVPFEVRLIDLLVQRLIEACVLIGDSNYLTEAAAAIDAHEEVLGESAQSMGMSALIAQFRGEDDAALNLCDRALEAVHHYPDPALEFKIGLCLSSIRGHEARGLALAEDAAKRSKRYDFFLMLAALSEAKDPAKARLFASEAERFARRNDADAGRDLEATRSELQQQRAYLDSVRRR
jgi:hypothetical protein